MSDQLAFMDSGDGDVLGGFDIKLAPGDASFALLIIPHVEDIDIFAIDVDIGSMPRGIDLEFLIL